jgi:hypothetical protein
MRANKQFQATASLREAAPELRRWAPGKEVKIVFFKNI